MFFFFPAGLVLYWLTNNILSIAQQWYINKQPGRAGQVRPQRDGPRPARMCGASRSPRFAMP
jgi:membrane protein insertase Oxa1/YidC/SpoIIIJ